MPGNRAYPNLIFGLSCNRNSKISLILTIFKIFLLTKMSFFFFCSVQPLMVLEIQTNNKDVNSKLEQAKCCQKVQLIFSLNNETACVLRLSFVWEQVSKIPDKFHQCSSYPGALTWLFSCPMTSTDWRLTTTVQP